MLSTPTLLPSPQPRSFPFSSRLYSIHTFSLCTIIHTNLHPSCGPQSPSPPSYLLHLIYHHTASQCCCQNLGYMASEIRRHRCTGEDGSRMVGEVWYQTRPEPGPYTQDRRLIMINQLAGNQLRSFPMIRRTVSFSSVVCFVATTSCL